MAQCIVTGYAGIEEIMAEDPGNWQLTTLNDELFKEDVNENMIKNIAKGVYILTNGKNL